MNYSVFHPRKCSAIGCGFVVWDMCIIQHFCLKHCHCPENQKIRIAELHEMKLIKQKTQAEK